MTRITIYMEGGGDSEHQKSQIRQAMDVFLVEIKNKARRNGWGWRLTPCGGRQAAYDAFSNAMRRPAAGEIIMLLVDSEAPVTARTRAEHLRKRVGDGWNLAGVTEDQIQFMVQVMETWIIADPETLKSYYGQYFRANALPARQNLEEEPKLDCAAKLAAATRPTQKGEYTKIRHAADLLSQISPQIVRERCLHADILFSTLDRLIQ